MTYFVYALQSETDGGLYVGMSSDVHRRLQQHNSGQTRSTKARLPFRLFHVEEFDDRLTAREREKYFKSGSGRDLLRTLPGWRNWHTQRT
jgi:putative endonuclease